MMILKNLLFEISSVESEYAEHPIPGDTTLKTQAKPKETEEF